MTEIMRYEVGSGTVLVEVMRELAPEHLELQFGVKLAGEAGAIIARNCADAHFTVTMSFTAPPAPPPAAEEEIRL